MSLHSSMQDLSRAHRLSVCFLVVNQSYHEASTLYFSWPGPRINNITVLLSISPHLFSRHCAIIVWIELTVDKLDVFKILSTLSKPLEKPFHTFTENHKGQLWNLETVAKLYNYLPHKLPLFWNYKDAYRNYCMIKLFFFLKKILLCYRIIWNKLLLIYQTIWVYFVNFVFVRRLIIVEYINPWCVLVIGHKC